MYDYFLTLGDEVRARFFVLAFPQADGTIITKG